MPNSSFKNLTLQDLIEDYIDQSGSVISNLSPSQYAEIKKAFVAGMSVAIKFQIEAHVEFDNEEECTAYFTRIAKECADFWIDLNKYTN